MSKQPRGPITTLLDLTDRDAQENDIFPLKTEITWFSRAKERKTVSFSPQIQTILFRGPAAFGQHFTFDLGSLHVGDLMIGAALEIKLGHWLDAGIQNRLAAGIYSYVDPSKAWEYSNALGASIIQSAELEIDGVTVETIDGDFIEVFCALYSDYNTQFGVAYDSLGQLPIATLRTMPPRLFPTEDGTIRCPLPFFFGRVRNQEALPLVAIKEGLVRLHIILRPFTEVVRQVRGYRDSCDSVPIATSIAFTDGTNQHTAITAAAAPSMTVALVTHGAVLEGELRQGLLRKPFEMLHRELQTFSFDEPLKYTVNKRKDTIVVQLPLEPNHPVEEMVWFIRRKGTGINNEWTNFSDKLEQEWTGANFRTNPMLVSARVQVNGILLVEADEQYFRQHIASKHKGGYVPYEKYIYGLSFAEAPGGHEPTGSINTSRANSVRLTLEVRPLQGLLDSEWEVKVFCMAINWMRYENGLANAVFED